MSDAGRVAGTSGVPVASEERKRAHKRRRESAGSVGRLSTTRGGTAAAATSDQTGSGSRGSAQPPTKIPSVKRKETNEKSASVPPHEQTVTPVADIATMAYNGISAIEVALTVLRRTALAVASVGGGDDAHQFGLVSPIVQYAMTSPVAPRMRVGPFATLIFSVSGGQRAGRSWQQAQVRVAGDTGAVLLGLMDARETPHEKNKFLHSEMVSISGYLRGDDSCNMSCRYMSCRNNIRNMSCRKLLVAAKRARRERPATRRACLPKLSTEAAKRAHHR